MIMVANEGHALQFKSSNDVRHSVENGVLTVTIDRPEKRNPLSLGVLERIREIFLGYREDDSLRCAVVTGSGTQSFASGGDLAELATYRDHQDAISFSRHGRAALDAVRTFPVPVIARVNGVALGGGAELALSCDMRFAAATARIGFIHGKLHIAPSWGGGNDLARLVGPARALDLMTKSTILGAEDAVEIGLFNAAAPANEPFKPWLEAQLGTVLSNPPQVMRAFKSIIVAGRPADRLSALELETEYFADVWVHSDHWAAVTKLESRGK